MKLRITKRARKLASAITGKQSLRPWVTFGLLLALALGTLPARAAVSFTGDFDPGNWLPGAQAGQVYFSDPGSGTQLVMVSVYGPPEESVSLEQATFIGPGGGGASISGMVSFHWTFNAGDTTSATAELGTLAGLYILDSGGPGKASSGTFSFPVSPRDGFAFLLSTDSPANKRVPAEFVISDLQYTVVPEAATGWAGALLLALLAGGWAFRRMGTVPR